MNDTARSFFSFLVAFSIYKLALSLFVASSIYSVGDAAVAALGVDLLSVVVGDVVESSVLAAIATAVVVITRRVRSRRPQAGFAPTLGSS